MTDTRPLIVGRNTPTIELDHWQRRHNEALLRPNRVEQPIIALIGAITSYVQAQEIAAGGIWLDYVLGQGVVDLLDGFRTLLNGDLQRLDAGTLDAWACGMAARIGWDIDRSRWMTDVVGGE